MTKRNTKGNKTGVPGAPPSTNQKLMIDDVCKLVMLCGNICNNELERGRLGIKTVGSCYPCSLQFLRM